MSKSSSRKLLLSVGAALTAVCGNATASDDWNHTVVDSTGNTHWISMELDIWNLPHIAYEKDGEIWYACRNAGEWNWNTEQVAAVGFRPSITLRADCSPVIVFSAQYGGEVGVADRTGSGWELEYLDLEALQPAGQYNPADGLHIYYIRNGDPTYVRHIRRWCGVWHNQTNWWLAGNPQTSPFVSEYDPAWGSRICYSFRWSSGGDSWSFVMLNGDGYHGGFWTDYSIAGRPAFDLMENRVAFCYRDGGELFYIEDSGNPLPSYGPYLIDEEGRFPSLSRDDQNRTHLAYRLPDLTVRYLLKTGTSWETTDLPHSVGSYGVDLETDSHDSPHMAMMTFGGNLEYTWYGDPTGIEEDVPQHTGRILHRLTPVPTSGPLTVMLDECVTGPVSLSVIDLSGRTVMESISDGSEMVMDLSSLSSGLYLMTAEKEGRLDSALFTVLR